MNSELVEAGRRERQRQAGRQTADRQSGIASTCRLGRVPVQLGLLAPQVLEHMHIDAPLLQVPVGERPHTHAHTEIHVRGQWCAGGGLLAVGTSHQQQCSLSGIMRESKRCSAERSLDFAGGGRRHTHHRQLLAHRHRAAQLAQLHGAGGGADQEEVGGRRGVGVRQGAEQARLDAEATRPRRQLACRRQRERGGQGVSVVYVECGSSISSIGGPQAG